MVLVNDESIPVEMRVKKVSPKYTESRDHLRKEEVVVTIGAIGSSDAWPRGKNLLYGVSAWVGLIRSAIIALTSCYFGW